MCEDKHENTDRIRDEVGNDEISQEKEKKKKKKKNDEDQKCVSLNNRNTACLRR